MLPIPAHLRMLILFPLLAISATSASAAAEPALPTLPDRPRIELHGTLDGQPFWARILPPDAQFGNHRVMQLVYTPPTPEALGGAHLVDCPFILLDEHARILAWNGRDGLSSVVPGAPAGYQVSREIVEGEGETAKIIAQGVKIPGAHAWDVHLAPLLTAISWSAAVPASVRVVDFFGPASAAPLSCSWQGDQVDIAGKHFIVVPDKAGAFQRLVDETGSTRVEVVETPAAATP